MAYQRYILIHYSEIGLKKGNRRFFERQLKLNILQTLTDLTGYSLLVDFGRFLLILEPDAPVATIIERLKNVIGIAHFSMAYQGDPDLNILGDQILAHLENVPFQSFCIDTRRADKEFPFTSPEVNQIVGEKIATTLKKPVHLKHPDLRCYIHIYNKKVIYAFERIPGRRGLPVGSSGKVVCLLSSGIDSPVAAYRILTRGCTVVMVHFHSYPFTDKSSYHNAIALAQHLTQFQYRIRLYLVPLAPLQETIILHAPAKFRLLLYRRMMFRIAEKIAKSENARALVTGESVGQVASQTLENLHATSAMVRIPILRPLIGIDKETIMEAAQQLGTYSISIEPYKDCCSYLVPENPETRARLTEIESAENQLENIPTLINHALHSAEIMKLEWCLSPTPKRPA
ncbi:tRNA 4-thiouridine(8) synthase ThiI [candidate division KSB1 bacterium]|nr:tRNA 4-thiouridine(8) synthase ThiI [candidate division KSB1 bacterium]